MTKNNYISTQKKKVISLINCTKNEWPKESKYLSDFVIYQASI